MGKNMSSGWCKWLVLSIFSLALASCLWLLSGDFPYYSGIIYNIGNLSFLYSIIFLIPIFIKPYDHRKTSFFFAVFYLCNIVMISYVDFHFLSEIKPKDMGYYHGSPYIAANVILFGILVLFVLFFIFKLLLEVSGVGESKRRIKALKRTNRKNLKKLIKNSST